MSDLRRLPSVDRLLHLGECQALIEEYGRPLTLDAIHAALDEYRRGKSKTTENVSDAIILASACSLLVEWTLPTLIPVINASGVILHTNLGRAPFQFHDDDVFNGYSSLEYDLQAGERGSRAEHVEKQLIRLTGAEAAFVVNNNAAAVLLVLTALARRKRVIISRTQLVEIGGGFRVPDVLAQSGAKMVEIGTTNKVHPGDYEEALKLDAAAILRAHHSNYRLTGFTGEPTLQELAQIAHRQDALLIDDLGSGVLLDTAQFGLAHEPMIQESLTGGADLVCVSGDKLLGGPQAGIILGRKDLIAKVRKHPLARAVRIDKLSLTVLWKTLDLYLRDRVLEIPIWRMIGRSVKELDETASRWKMGLGVGDVIDGQSTVGGGSLPEETLPTRLLAIQVKSPNRMLAKLRANHPPIIARIEQDQVVCDPRTVFPEEEIPLLEGLRKVILPG